MDTDFLFVITSVFFFIWTFRSLFYWVEAWQKVKYKPQDVISNSFIKRRLSRYFFSLTSVVTWISILIALFISVTDYPIEWYQWLVLSVFGIKAGIFLTKSIKYKHNKPDITPLSLSIIAISFFILVGLYLFPLTEKYLWLLIVDRMKVFVVGFVISFFTFPSEIYQDIIVKNSFKKLKKLKKIRVFVFIGDEKAEITSYYSSQYLKKKGRVLALPLCNKFADSAVFLHKEISPQIDFLLIPFNPTNEEDLKLFFTSFNPEITVMVSTLPKVVNEGIISIMKSKLIIMTENSYFPIKKKNKNQKVIVLEENMLIENSFITRVTIQNIKIKKSHTVVELSTESLDYSLEFPFIGELQANLAVTALLIGKTVGLTKNEIEKESRKMYPFPHSGIAHFRHDGGVIIDNCSDYNELFLQELIIYISKGKKNKIVILGNSENDMTQLQLKKNIETIAKYATHLIVLDPKLTTKIRRIVQKIKSSCTVIRSEEKVAYSFLQSHSENAYILFIGEGALDMCENLISSTGTND